ncbi:MAG: LPS export ABC transporter permease LptF [Pseudomonadota bacterium]|nr:LPS export ABC transporter permease LptF [Pseudomonadota bacterium]MDE3038729.1 LPS export ABC transporter permease LptF [Pseudomonadota bacterium]
MYRYSNYIARHLVHSMLLITFSLTSIVWLTQALRFIDFIVNQGVSISVFLRLTLLLIPSLLLMILPPALFCSVLFVYNKLKIESELVVMQAAGLSKWRLAWPALQVAIGVTLIAYSVALYLLPVSYGRFRDMQNFLRNNYVSILLQDGVFSNPVDGLTIFIRERDKDGTLHGILVHDNRNPQAPVTMMAEEGHLVETPQGPRFLLKNGNRQEMRNGSISFLYFDSYTLDISLYAQAMKNRPVDTQEMFLPQLLAYNDDQTPADNQKRIAEGHQRIIWPAYSLMLTLIALAVLLSGQFNRRGHWQRVALAVGIGTAVLFCAVGLRGMTASEPAMVPVAYFNLLLPGGAALWVLLDRVPKCLI